MLAVDERRDAVRERDGGLRLRVGEVPAVSGERRAGGAGGREELATGDGHRVNLPLVWGGVRECTPAVLGLSIATY